MRLYRCPIIKQICLVFFFRLFVVLIINFIAGSIFGAVSDPAAPDLTLPDVRPRLIISIWNLRTKNVENKFLINIE